ncbi:MAG: hypothetical protein FD160_3717 [Caulobacteraceae bacterium]|nr:MAG: hypothetical protein FD160_3717 [Caulobacteraceae bacterium]
MRYEFESELWMWKSPDAPASWRFVTLPKDVSQAIRTLTPLRNGFGSLRVSATVGKTTWKTSLFPSKEQGAFLLPMKADVRKKEKLSDGDMVKVAVELDF